MAQLQNLVMLEDGIISYQQVGTQNQNTAVNTIAVIRLLAGGMSEVKLLADYTDSGEMDDKAVQNGFDALQTLPLDKVAVIGASPYLKKLIIKMASAAGKSEIIHFAKSRESAIEWLKK